MRSIMLFTLMIPCWVKAQNFFSLSATYGSFNMSTQRQIQDYTLNSFSPIKMVSSFPSRFGLEMTTGVRVGQGSFTLGPAFSYFSTGGRLHYADYSGEVSFDQIAECFMVGLHAKGLISNPEKKLRMYLAATASAVFTTLEYRSYFALGTQTESSEEQVTVVNYSLRPALSVQRSFAQDFYAEVHLGYDLQLIKGDPKVEWDGLRCGIAIGYHFTPASNPNP